MQTPKPVGADNSQPAGEYAQKDAEHTAQPTLADGTVIGLGQHLTDDDVARANTAAIQQAQESQQQAQPQQQRSTDAASHLNGGSQGFFPPHQ